MICPIKRHIIITHFDANILLSCSQSVQSKNVSLERVGTEMGSRIRIKSKIKEKQLDPKEMSH